MLLTTRDYLKSPLMQEESTQLVKYKGLSLVDCGRSEKILMLSPIKNKQLENDDDLSKSITSLQLYGDDPEDSLFNDRLVPEEPVPQRLHSMGAPKIPTFSNFQDSHLTFASHAT